MAAETSTNRQQSETPRVVPRLRKQYDEVAVPALTEQFGYTNLMQVPKIQKVVINIGMGEAVGNAKALDNAVGDIQIITGQKPVVTRAKRSIAQFKIRAGDADRRDGDVARARGCTSSLTGSSISPCRVCVTSAACRRMRSMGMATTPSA